MPRVRLASGLRLLGIPVVTGILGFSGSGCGSSTGTMTIVNVDGPGVAVVPWSGGPTIVVGCGTSRVVKPTSAPASRGLSRLESWRATTYCFRRTGREISR